MGSFTATEVFESNGTREVQTAETLPLRVRCEMPGAPTRSLAQLLRVFAKKGQQKRRGWEATGDRGQRVNIWPSVSTTRAIDGCRLILKLMPSDTQADK
ncbi:hypothetical protein TNCV_2404551 [Trichonephila clavipes]|nr:hypothetical protein TNCV_2404551 [Trichonephila clavipes]